MASSIFVSHTHADKPIADALNEAVSSLFGEYAKIAHSSDKEIGPQHGARWLAWINDQVKSSDFTLVLLTPASLQKPWILWEAGAVAGTAVASGNADGRKVRPLVFRVPQDQIPDPFRDVQIVKGDDAVDMEAMLSGWMTLLPGPAAAKAGRNMDSVLKRYMTAVTAALDNAPLVPTEGIIQEWCVRLDELKEQKRMSEVKTIHDWLNIAFGRDREDRPLDVRLHRRMGELYLNSRNYNEAVTQFELARQLSPRDILILRELGLAYLGQDCVQETKGVIEQIEKLDKTAFERNVECAALKGRWLRKQSPRAALDVYRNAFQYNSNSYYLGDLLGQMELQLGEEVAARETYKKVLEIINAVAENNVWIQATAANAAIVAKADASVIREKLHKIRDCHPTPENLSSIEGGLRRVQKALQIEESVFNDWVAALRQ